MSRHGHDTAEPTRGTWQRHDHTRCDTVGGQAATRHAHAGLGAPGCAGWSVGCALGASILFFYSVLFLSHCLDTVYEQCSPNFFRKKI